MLRHLNSLKELERKRKDTEKSQKLLHCHRNHEKNNETKIMHFLVLEYLKWNGSYVELVKQL